jgi:RNA polymerase sigma-70 factor (ECF subfamily)
VKRAPVAAALERLAESGRAAHPTLAVEGARFLEHLAGVTRGVPADALDRIRAGDLYLAFACARRVPGALEAFEVACGTALEATLRVPVAARFGEDARQLLYEHLFVGGGADGAPRILAYAGRGPLTAWVAVSARRAALSLRRRETVARAGHAAAGRERIEAGIHPELAYLKRKYRVAFADAFGDAFGGLTDRERTLLRLHLQQRLRLDQIAPMFHVDTSTVSRWLAAARARILAQTRALVVERLRIRAADFASMARLLRSQIDVSLVRLLGSQGPVPR